MNENTETILIIGISIFAGFFMGHGLVYVFNKIPVSWLCDYGHEPDQSLLEEGYRIKGFPWKYVFSATFIVVGIYMGLKDPRYAVAGGVAIWALLEIAIADIKYMIIPDQFTILLGITALGFIPFHSNYLTILWGFLGSTFIMILVALVGKLILKKESLGFGDIKLCGALGICFGLKGVIFILLLSGFTSGVFAAIRLIRKKAKKGDMQPMAPFISASAIIYILFFMSI